MNIYLRATILIYLAFNINHVNAQREQKLVPFTIPENRELKKTLGYMEDSYLNFTELTSKYRYASQQHTVITKDGYILTLFRILPKCSEVKPFPVLLMHGILDSSDVWIVSGPKTGLGYILADNCYDVWAANHRGNQYSRKHVRLDPDTDVEYWNYTFDEHGNYDLPALVDYILEMSKRPRLYYIGHSQGTTNFFVMTSLRPKYNEKIRLSIHLAPVAWVGNLASPIPRIMALIAEHLREFLQKVGYNEIFAKNQIIHVALEFLCQAAPNEVCGLLLNIVTGYKNGTISSGNLTVSFGHLLVGTSIKSLAHFGQLVLSKNFQRYDEGRLGNLRRYKTTTPPSYNVSRISSPVVLFNAHNDWLSTMKDTSILTSKLPNVIENYLVPEKYWSHHNHVFGINAPIYVFPKILDYMLRYES